jgi:hypothetical protein
MLFRRHRFILRITISIIIEIKPFTVKSGTALPFAPGQPPAQPGAALPGRTEGRIFCGRIGCGRIVILILADPAAIAYLA